ncbi:MAG: 3-dehydroquinate synthase [Cryobacterium sp.]|jgi:3-dehydroquinate synthase|nr:3-dehydroquinate synthase [Cryobacterium sp.]
MTAITVSGSQPYDVHIGRGIIADVGARLGNSVRKVLLIHQPSLSNLASAMREQLSGEFEVLLAEIPDGEAAKRIEVAAFCWQILGTADFTRSDAIIGFGGGAATDLAGFVASTWLRGVQSILVPTTVLGMVDAAIGGKTGVNTSEGKNLVGTFFAPSAVIADLDILAGLDRAETLSGFAEIVKCGFIADPEILDILERDLGVATDTATTEFQNLVELSVGVKARVVGEDFRETGMREILNYGHTLGHAIEYAERFRWRHGDAVAVGMVFAAELARLAGRLGDDVVARHRALLTGIGLPITYPVGRWNTLMSVMKRDKKARGELLRFVILDDVARPTILPGPDESLLFAAWQEVGG